MLHAQRPLRALFLAAVLATSTSAAYLRSNPVFARADVCGGDPDLSRCAQTGLPDNFCCNTGTECIPLAGDTTVLCCPEGSTCDSINPIVCDLGLQDPARNPNAAIKTTVLGGKLETCGSDSLCCPYGYSCEDGSCTMDRDQSQKPGGASPSSTKTSSATATATAVTSTPPTTTSASSKPTMTTTTSSSSTASESEGEAATAEPSKDESPPAGFPTTAVIGGVVGGLAGLACVTVLVMMCRYRRQQAAKKRHDSSSSFGNIISAPQPLGGYANQRQDFLAKASTSSAATTPTTTQVQERFGGGGGSHPPFSPLQPYYRMKEEEEEGGEGQHHRSRHPSAEVGGLLGLRDLTSYGRFSSLGYGGGNDNHNHHDGPATPRERRRPSDGSEGESINIFADPSTVGGRSRDTAYTTWTNVMGDGETTPRLPDSPTRRRL